MIRRGVGRQQASRDECQQHHRDAVQPGVLQASADRRQRGRTGNAEQGTDGRAARPRSGDEAAVP